MLNRPNFITSNFTLLNKPVTKEQSLYQFLQLLLFHSNLIGIIIFHNDHVIKIKTRGTKYMQHIFPTIPSLFRTPHCSIFDKKGGQAYPIQIMIYFLPCWHLAPVKPSGHEQTSGATHSPLFKQSRDNSVN